MRKAAAGPVNHRLALRNSVEVGRQAADLDQGRFVLTRRLTGANAPGSSGFIVAPGKAALVTVFKTKLENIMSTDSSQRIRPTGVLIEKALADLVRVTA